MREIFRRGHPRLIAWALGTLILVLTLSACASRTRTTPAMAETDWEVQVESPLDTLQVPSGGAAEGTVPGEDAAAVSTDDATAVSRTPAPAPTEPVVVPDPRDFAPGWRVQIAALSSLATAEQVAEEARSRFQEPVYVEYEPPLYKVRVGDFLVREEAESLKTRAHSQDYEKAWVVETLVLKPAR
jgi:cell division septation protein DedD